MEPPHLAWRVSFHETCTWIVLLVYHRVDNHNPLSVLEGCEAQSSLCGLKQVDTLAADKQTVQIYKMADEEGKIKLFESDEEAEEEEDIHDDFKIRPEYQGPHGLQMLEMNSQLSKRFKLDERFAEDFEPDDFKRVEEEYIPSEIDEEKKKNMRILESILGHEITKPVKPADKTFSKKQLIRFDPEDENASKFVKTPESVKEKPKKSKKKKGNSEEKPEEVIPISTERYIEVDPNLKDILSSSTPFSFSQRFNFEHNETTLDSINDTSEFIVEMEVQDVEKPKETKLFPVKQVPRLESSAPKSKYASFFISEDDPRLKEGIEFFKRPKPLEELRVEWQNRRERILELFRRKRRSGHRSHTTKVQTVQMKNMIRKNNFRR